MDLSKFEGHTPGPWEWIGYDLESEKGTPMEVTVRCGQYCQGGSPHVDITDADHALIAAAPELLEEVTRLRAKVEELDTESCAWYEEAANLINRWDARIAAKTDAEELDAMGWVAHHIEKMRELCRKSEEANPAALNDASKGEEENDG